MIRFWFTDWEFSIRVPQIYVRWPWNRRRDEYIDEVLKLWMLGSRFRPETIMTRLITGTPLLPPGTPLTFTKWAPLSPSTQIRDE